MTREDAPEDLLLRARQCQLDEAEEKRFDIALRASRELELLYQAGVEFDARASLLPGDERRLGSLVERTMAALQQGAPPQARATQGSSHALARVGHGALAARYFAASLAVGLLLSVALASAWDYVEKRRAPARAVASARTTNSAAATRGRAVKLAPAPAAPTASELKVEPEPAAPSNSIASSVLHASAAPAKALRTVDSPPNALGAAHSVAQLFSEANELRRQGDAAGAILLYQNLCAEYPSSAEAEDTRILLGNLLLDQNSARAALAQFEGYGTGALMLEALWGKARALRALRSPDERNVLEMLVRDYPSSAYAAAAHKRLHELRP